ncbi:MAG: TetR/AcrR family transcriptional regulator [Oscillospiraceae bacterium]|nr:TetR/AcrR family transcriptional regulator [Oscillospiraceae bacterium]
MRITKDAKERRNEILDIAQRLFHEKGYGQTTIEDILKEAGIAKGTIYYHFKSKEEILSAMIDRQLDRREEEFCRIAENETLTPVEKLMQVISLQAQQGTLAEGLHEKENAELHQKTFQRSLLRFAPIMTKIVEQGIKKGDFSTPYPREGVELLFCASQLHDPGVFSWTPEEYRKKMDAFFWMTEATLGISPEATAQLHTLLQAAMKQEDAHEHP